MPLIKFSIDKSEAGNSTYLVAGNRVRLADVDNDLVAEKLFNAKVPGVSLVQIPVVEPGDLKVAEPEQFVLPAAEPVAATKSATAKK